MSAIIFLIGVYVRNSNEERVLWISEEISSHLKQIAVHRFSVERGVYVNVSKRVVDASDLEYIPHVPCHQREVHLSGESKKRNGDSSQNAALFVIRAHLRARCRDCKNTEHLPSLSLSLTSPFLPASLSRAVTMATLWPMGVSSGTFTVKSDVRSNSGLLSFSSRMVMDTCPKNPPKKHE